ncbi:MAG: PAS domain S-box protein [Deltaproteobacteria bacterium]|nr:PAS domain S-box protein [Deltaproteobacteria bacterium]
MRLKTQFIIALLLFGFILIVIAGSAIITNIEMEKARRQGKIADAIVRGASELNYLSNDYLIYREDPQLKRWRSGFANFSKQVAGLRADRPEQQALIANIQAGQKQLKEVFDSLASASVSLTRDPGAALVSPLFQVSWSRMAVQCQGLVADAARLSYLFQQMRDQLTETRTRLIYFLLGLFGLFLVSGYWLTHQRILKSMAKLEAGAAVIGSGNLDFVFEEMKNDEIGELARAFNRMTTDLKAVTASKTDLEREMAERRQAEEELRRQREWLRVTLTSIGDAVLTTDAAGRITFLNPIAQALTQWPLEEAAGQPTSSVFRIINEKTNEPAEDIVGRVLREGLVVTLANHTALIDREGRVIPIEDSAAPILNADGNVTGVVLVFHDVTEKRRAQLALAESEKHYRTLFETMTEGFALHEIICDDLGRPCDYRFLQVNPAFERLTGLRAVDLVGRTLYEALPQAESLWVERYGAVALTGRSAHFDQWSEALGRHFEVIAFQTEPGFFGVVFRDVSARRQAEEALHASRRAALNLLEDAEEARREVERINADLELRVRERTAELSAVVDRLQDEIDQRQHLEDTLRQSEQRVRFFASQCLTAQEKERRRVAGELHDSIVASLAAIKIGLEKARDEREAGRIIPESFTNLIIAVQQTIVDVRRIMADLRPSLLDDLGLIAALNWFCREFQKTYPSIRIESRIGLAEGDLPDSLKTPIFRLSQEALNNIAKHSRAGLVCLSLLKESDRLQLIVKDNGRGFNPDQSLKGLGLSTMRERAELSGGAFAITSGQGGTIVRASWPLGSG